MKILFEKKVVKKKKKRIFAIRYMSKLLPMQRDKYI